MAAAFPTNEEFAIGAAEAVAGKTRVVYWSKLEVGVIHRIDGWRWQDGSYGGGVVLALSTESGLQVEAWATPIITRDLGLLDVDAILRMPTFIKPLGLTPCRGDPSRKYHNFQLMFGVVK